MDKRKKWIATKITTGRLFLAAGVLVIGIGTLIERQYSYLPYNFRVITGLGILLTGIGVGYLVKYRAALKDEEAARRFMVDERDERTRAIRARAGNRAYWVATALVYAGLMWVSLAANGSLPALSADALWYFLAVAAVIPFGVYIAGIVMEQRT